jgi:flagellar biosynthesis protein FlhF
MAAKKIVLIDTHGVSQRDHVALKSLTSLIEGSGHKISVYLALPCNQQESILNEIVERFTFKRINGCILTKIDESIKVTPALGVVMKHNLSLAYLCNGQDLERDISLPTVNAVADSLPIIFHNDVVDVVLKEKNRKSKWMRMIRGLNFMRSLKLFRTFRFGH